MKRCVGPILLFMLAAAAAAFAGDQETLQQLISRANSAPPAQQPDLFLEVADRQVKAAADSYSANKPEDGRVALNQTVDYADKAHALVLKSGEKLPHTEIKIRRMAARLRDLKQNVDADGQAVVQGAVDKLEAFRTDLLKGMFGAKKPGSK